MKPRHYICSLLLLILQLSWVGCMRAPHDVVPSSEPLVIYPDYQDVTVPCNIAPLNFMLRGDYDAIAFQLKDSSGNMLFSFCDKGTKMIFDEYAWQGMMQSYTGQQLTATLMARRTGDGQWVQFPDFGWTISSDKIDPFITYRLIEPGYEVWDNVCIEERCTENFASRLLADGRQLGNRCMNCHTHGGDRGQYSFFYLRGEGGGTILNREGKLRKVTLRSPQMRGGTVYGDWHPSGRYAVFSTNVIIPAFHADSHRRLEVYDTESDLCVADFDRDTILLCPLVTNTATSYETFPAFSADGRWIYFCTADNPCGDTLPSATDLRDKIHDLHYSLCRLAFDTETGTFGNQIDTIYNARLEGHSVSFPKCSPNGQYLCFTLSDSGTFPIWHREARLGFLRLAGDDIVACIPTDENGTYHSWSHNSRWIAFASKRTDGQYGRVYFAHVEDNGLSKPLTLPQADPEMDDWNLLSYNIPDLSTEPVAFDQNDVKTLFEQVSAAPFR